MVRLEEAMIILVPYPKDHVLKPSKGIREAVRQISGSRSRFLVSWEMVFQSFTASRLLDPRLFSLDLSHIQEEIDSAPMRYETPENVIIISDDDADLDNFDTEVEDDDRQSVQDQRSSPQEEGGRGPREILTQSMSKSITPSEYVDSDESDDSEAELDDIFGSHRDAINLVPEIPKFKKRRTQRPIRTAVEKIDEAQYEELIPHLRTWLSGQNGRNVRAYLKGLNGVVGHAMRL